MLKTLSHQAIALAGLSQAVYLVQEIAKHGRADREAMAASIGSTLKIDADDVIDGYGGLDRIKLGLRLLDQQLSTPDRVEPNHVRYASTLIFLERKLVAAPRLLDVLSASLHRAAIAADRTQVLDHEVIEILAGTYQETLSTLKPRVLVTGEAMYLSDPDNAQLIRALLLAGIRSATLWRQCGGARWKLLLLRPGLQKEARKLLDAL